MKIINHHLGLPVISLDTSERAGDVIRFITDQVASRIVAVAVARKWYQEPHGVLFEECRAFGQNVVLISRRDALRPLSEMQEVSLHLEAGNDARQRTAITEGGRLLGSVTDEAFDEITGEVRGYRLDVMGDTGTGRTVYVPHSAFVTSSGAVAILREDVLEGAFETLEELASGERAPAPEPTEDAPSPAEDLRPETYHPEPPPAPAPAYDPAPAQKHPLLEPEPPVGEEGGDDEDLFEDTAAGDELDADAEDFAPTLPDAEPPVATEPAPEPRGHDRVMMALSLGQVAQTAVRDPSGSILVEAGEVVTDAVTHAAARAGAETLYALWKATQEP